MFAKLADTITKHSKAIFVLWLVIVICALPIGLKASDNLEYDLLNMTGDSSESAQGEKIIEDQFPNAINMEEVLVLKYTSDQSSSVSTLSDKVSELLNTHYNGKVTLTYVGVYHKDTSSNYVNLYTITCSDGSVSFATDTGSIRDVVKQAVADTGSSITTYVTGDAALTYDTMQSANEDIKKVDPVSIVLIFVLLMAFFGAIATAVIPPVGFGAAYAVALLFLYIFSSATGVYYLSETLMLVTMLGAGCDYGIFIITRYREELKKGAAHHDALTTAVEWAGESVFTSGLSVIIGFACLAICDFALVRTMGVVLAAGIVFALISALTVVPSIINMIGERTFWPNSIAKYRAVDNGTRKGIYARATKFFHGYFVAVARVTRKHAVPIVAVAVLISIPTFYVYATSSSSYDMIAVEPDGDAKEGLYAIMDETYSGTLMPTYVVMELDSCAVQEIGSVTLAGTTAPYLKWTSDALSCDSGKYSGYVPSLMGMATKITSDYSIVASASATTSWAVLYSNAKAASPEATADQINDYLLSQMPSAVVDYVETYLTAATIMAKLSGTEATPDYVLDTSKNTTLANHIDYVLNIGTGILSENGNYVSMMVVTTEEPMSDGTMDFVSDLKDAFHGSNGYDTTMSSVFKSSKICGQNAVMKDVSGTVSSQFTIIQIVVIVLLLVLLFLILGCYLTPIRAMVCIMLSVIWTLALSYVFFEKVMNLPICWIVPIVLFVVLLGLGMDYDIFITTRVRENRVRGMSNDDAIDAAICSASGTISLCALIMGGTFLTLLIGSSAMLQEFGFALGIGILIDGLFMVTFVGPAVMHLMGEWSWKGPKRLQRKHIEAEQASDEAQ